MYYIRLIFLLLFASGSIYSQSYDFKNIGKEKRIQAKYIYDIEQGKNQKLYLGTELGLFSYNGLSFEMLVSSKENIVNVIEVDSSFVYQGYFDGSLGVFSLKDNTQSIFPSPYESKIVGIDSYEGNIIVLIQGEGLFTFRDGEFSRIDIYNLTAEDIISCRVVGDFIIIATYSELLSVERKNAKWVIKESIVEYEEKTPFKIESYNNQLCAVLCQDLSIDIIDLNGEVSELKNTIQINGLNTRPTDLNFGINNQLWVSTINEGLVKVSSPDSSFLSYNLSFYSSKNGLIGDEVKSVYTDNQGVLWIGQYGEGVSNLVSEQVVLYENINGVEINRINCTEQVDSEGVIFLGHRNGVWRVQFGANFVIDNISLPIPDMDIKALCYDNNTSLWIGSAENGLFIYDIKTKEVSSAMELFGEEVLYINRISLNKWNNNIYVSTDLGLYYFKSKTGELIKLTTNDGLAHNVLNDVLVLKTGEIWFAPNGSPIFSLKDDEISVHKDLQGLTSYSAYCMKESTEGRILVGTESDGLVIIKDEKVLHKIDESNGLINNTVFDIVELNDGTIWTFHKSAISVLDSELNRVHSFSAEDDLFDVDLTRNGVYNNRSNYIWAACNKGLLRVYQRFKEESTPPSIEITALKVNDDKLKSIPNQFEYGSYSFNFSFMAIDINNSSKIQYQYYLEGLESDWKTFRANHNFASYPKISEGSYVFKVRAINKWGQYSPEITIPFEIAIPYWKSLWFIILIPVLILLMIFLFFQWRLVRIRAQKFHLETVVRDRTFELRMEKENLSKAKVNIEDKNKEITDSINYAERIQNAILPDVNDPKITKEEIILFFQPRDIVSGDFYWVNYVDGKQIIVVADCTGHGVPGAFMSLISSTLIDKIVFDLGVTDPEGMVRLLDANIEKVLRSKDSEAKDGIDIGILSIDRKNNLVEYCGASRPLFLIKDDELKVLRGGMLAIGDYYDNIEKEFVTHQFPIEKGTMLYLSSDGFPDQFGGDRDRKYMIGKFKKFLFSIRNHSAETQKDLVEKEFNRWKKNGMQTDDVLVIGVKL